MNFTQDFHEHLRTLNDEQRQAVDQINGPVLVLAGPGTGKTELLSMRVANILQKTDALPNNILCLTFTDAASQNMTERMAKLFGHAAYQVAVYTFHAFCSEIINRYDEYFYDGARMSIADDISKLEILNAILKGLSPSNPISGSKDDIATHLASVQKAISHVKREGAYTPEDLRNLMKENLQFINFAEPLLAELFADKISAKTTIKAIDIHKKLSGYKDQASTLAMGLVNDLADAINAATASGKTKPITAFKNQYFNAKLVRLKDRARTEKTLALADVHKKYENELFARDLHDFDDIIVRVVHEIENNPTLRAELQEQFQYILVDEFQDTNNAQMRVVNALADEPNSNIFAVGDDDQAIYSFQGANVNNIQSFKLNHPDAKFIQLHQNYRSDSDILNLADATISNAEIRIKKNFFSEPKKLLAAKKEAIKAAQPTFITTIDSEEQYALVAEKIAASLQKNPAQEIACLARNHKSLQSLLPHLRNKGINNIAYKNNLNVLDSPPIKALANLARIIAYIADNKHKEANLLLPELLAHDAWSIPAVDIWRLSLTVEHRGNWLETMLKTPAFADLANWLIEMSKSTKHQPLKPALIDLFNKAYKEHYFSAQKQVENPGDYLDFLAALTALYDKLGEYQTKETPTLKDFVNFLDTYQKFNARIESPRVFGDKPQISLLTTHAAKGLEFDSVYIIDAIARDWLTTKASSFFPSNLHLDIPGNLDENIRLVFVAITRAKENLFVFAPEKTSRRGDDLTIKPFLGSINEVAEAPASSSIENHEVAWDYKLTTPNANLKTLLKPLLENYKLTASSLNAFINLEYAGPNKFLLEYLLRFPTADSPNIAYGNAVHAAFRCALNHFQKNGAKAPHDQIEKIFLAELKSQRLADEDFKYYSEKGIRDLTTYLYYIQFKKHQKSELALTATLDSIPLYGKVDFAEIDEKSKTVKIVDIKTSSPFDKFDSIYTKTHTYKNQLLFYKLLIENSPRFQGYRVTEAEIHFVSPDKKTGEIKTLPLNITDGDLVEFQKLLKSVWTHIQNLDFPDVSDYEKNLRGTLRFEGFLKDA